MASQSHSVEICQRGATGVSNGTTVIQLHRRPPKSRSTFRSLPSIMIIAVLFGLLLLLPSSLFDSYGLNASPRMYIHRQASSGS